MHLGTHQPRPPLCPPLLLSSLKLCCHPDSITLTDLCIRSAAAAGSSKAVASVGQRAGPHGLGPSLIIITSFPLLLSSSWNLPILEQHATTQTPPAASGKINSSSTAAKYPLPRLHPEAHAGGSGNCTKAKNCACHPCPLTHSTVGVVMATSDGGGEGSQSALFQG